MGRKTRAVFITLILAVLIASGSSFSYIWSGIPQVVTAPNPNLAVTAQAATAASTLRNDCRTYSSLLQLNRYGIGPPPPVSTPESNGSGMSMIYYLAAAIALIIIAVVAVILLLKRRHSA